MTSVNINFTIDLKCDDEALTVCFHQHTSPLIESQLCNTLHQSFFVLIKPKWL